MYQIDNGITWYRIKRIRVTLEERNWTSNTIFKLYEYPRKISQIKYNSYNIK